MARQRIIPQAAVKVFESYTDFSGGLNSTTANELLRDNEFPVLDNVDLQNNGSAKRRKGRTFIQSITGTPQGMQYFYRSGQSTPDVLYMSGGKFYISQNITGTAFEVPIKDGYSTFTYQSTLPVEATQYNKLMYIATGTKLCELGYTNTAWQTSKVYGIGDRVVANGNIYECTQGGTSNTTGTGPSFTTVGFWKPYTAFALNDFIVNNNNLYKVTTAGTTGTVAPTASVGTTTDGTVVWTYQSSALDGTVGWKFIATHTNFYYAKTVEAYKPNQMEFVYVGTNALASNPPTYVSISDELGITLGIKGITTSTQSDYAVINTAVTFTCFSIYTSAVALSTIDYQWEYKKSSDTTWTVFKGWWGAGGTNKSVSTTFDTATDYDVRVTIRQVGTTPTAQYVLTNFTVQPTASIILPYSGINKCRKILLHWDRIIAYADDVNSTQIYISDLANPAYFPTTNTVSFDTGKQEPLEVVVKYRDYLVMMSKTCIYAFTGKSPDDYRTALIHDGIGCIAGRTAQTVGNNIMFLSSEGLFQLRPNQLVVEVLNVFRGDNQIKGNVPLQTDACAMVYDSQYWISFPSTGYYYRYYYEQNKFVRDISSTTKALKFLQYGNYILELNNTGEVYLQNSTFYDNTAQWKNNQAYTVGTRVINALNNNVYECTVAGTSGAVPPSHTTGTATDGTVTWKFIASVYGDKAELYNMKVQSKYLDLSMSFNYKKLKRFYVLARHFTSDVNLNVKVEADANITLTSDTSHAELQGTSVVWVVSSEPNFHFYSGSIVGTWVLANDPLGPVEISVQRASVTGKCKRVRVTFEHNQNTPCEIYGFGLEFKEKKV